MSFKRSIYSKIPAALSALLLSGTLAAGSPSAPAPRLNLEVWNPAPGDQQNFKIAARISNLSSSPIALSRIKIKVWFNDPQSAANFRAMTFSNNNQVFNTAGQFQANVAATSVLFQDLSSTADCGFGRLANRVAVISFSEPALSIPAGGFLRTNGEEGAGETLATWHRADWTDLDSSDDYSRIDSGARSHASRANVSGVALYVDGALACEYIGTSLADSQGGQEPCGVSACPNNGMIVIPVGTTPKLGAELLALEASDEAVLAAKKSGAFSIEGSGRNALVQIIAKASGSASALLPHFTRHSVPVGAFVVGWIRVSQLGALRLNPALVQAQISYPVDPQLPRSRVEIGAQAAQDPSNCADTGAGVAVGVVDTGVDWRHYDFRTNVATSKIAFLWDQHLLAGGTGGTTPLGFPYGFQYTGAVISSALTAGGGNLAIVPSLDNIGHGTHVASTAAGSGFSGAAFRGIAPGSPVIAVNVSFTTGNVLDGVDYVFQQAANLSLPVVVNLSLGSQHGSHDGTELFDQALDARQQLAANANNAIVVSSGNNGNQNIHATANLPTGGTVDIPFTTPPTGSPYVFWLHAWFREGANFSDYQLFTPCGAFPIFPNGTVVSGTFCGPAAFVNMIAAPTAVQNGHAHLMIQVILFAPAPPLAWTLRLLDTGASGGLVDVWTEDSQFGSFIATQFSNPAQFEPQMTVGSPGTASEVITVGSYITFGGGVSAPLVPGNRSVFSARGPVRPIPAGNAVLSSGNAFNQKPDITAPGERIEAALRNTILGHIFDQGTSMAAPHVAGVVALIKSKNPGFDHTALKNQVRNTARRDGFTTGTPILWDVLWGYGKVNAFDGAGCLSPTFTPTTTPTRSPSVTRTPSPSRTASATRTNSRTVTQSRTASPTRTASGTRTISRTTTPSRTVSPTRTASGTRTNSRTVSPTGTHTRTATASPTITTTPTAVILPACTQTLIVTPGTAQGSTWESITRPPITTNPGGLQALGGTTTNAGPGQARWWLVNNLAGLPSTLLAVRAHVRWAGNGAAGQNQLNFDFNVNFSLTGLINPNLTLFNAAPAVFQEDVIDLAAAGPWTLAKLNNLRFFLHNASAPVPGPADGVQVDYVFFELIFACATPTPSNTPSLTESPTAILSPTPTSTSTPTLTPLPPNPCPGGCFSGAPAWTYNVAPANSLQPTLVNAGDVDNNGVKDLLVRDVDSVGAHSVRLLLMDPSGGVLSFISFPEPNPLSIFGVVMVALGDINGDSFDDFAVGEPGIAPFVYIYLGGIGPLTTPSQVLGGWEGVGSMAAGDFNGDGFRDLAVGYTGYNGVGIAQVSYGSGGGVFSGLFDNVAFGSTLGESLGVSLAAPDVNNDGFSDLVVGARGRSSSAGGADLIFGGAGLLSLRPRVSISGAGGGAFGAKVLNAGDTNGDTFEDVLVGALFYHNGVASVGRAHLFLGAPGMSFSTSAAWTMDSEQAALNLGLVLTHVTDQFGHGLAALGDIDGDGMDDVAIGAAGFGGNFLPYSASTGFGRIYVFKGHSSGLEAVACAQLAGVPGPNSNFGAEMAGNLDLSGDSALDLAVLDNENNGTVKAYASQPCTILLMPGPGPLAASRRDAEPKAPSDAVQWLKDKTLVAFPNPARSNARAAFWLDGPARARLRVAGLDGSIAKVLELGQKPAGESVVDLDLKGLGSGIYFLILESDAGWGWQSKAVFKMAVLR